MAAESGEKTILRKVTSGLCGSKNFVQIALSDSISEINTFLCLTQKFKMAAKSGRKMIFAKSGQ